MARKSRKVIPEIQHEQKKYRVGIYTRVSVNDNNFFGTLNNQEAIVKAHLQELADIEYVKTYVDNGLSSFAAVRPAFEMMKNDMEIGYINCLAVKDISRFSRDYLVAADYVQNIFPNLGVRFISVLEKYDSNLMSMEQKDMAFQGILNYYYSLDLSKKVRSAIKSKQESGEYILPKVPYGYKKIIIDNGTVIVPDVEQSKIVKKIFELSTEGNSNYSIVKTLNEDITEKIWTQKAVGRILQNDFYTGIYTLRKTRHYFRENLTSNTSELEKLRFENHHIPLISSETFQRINEMRGHQKPSYKQSKVKEDFFKAKLHCADCKRKMKRIKRQLQYSDEQRYSYVCPTYLESGGTRCTRKTITDDELKISISEDICSKAKVAKIYRENQLQYEGTLKFKIWLEDRTNKINQLKKELQKYEREQLRGLYENVAENGCYCKYDYILMSSVYEEKKTRIQDKIDSLQKEVDDYWRNISSENDWIKQAERYFYSSLSDSIEMFEKIYCLDKQIKMIY